MRRRVGILVGGGPAPGINSVIGAATIKAINCGMEVIGIQDGFEWISQGNVDHTVKLGIDDVSRIHFRGGSYIGISRYNPTKNKDDLNNVVTSLLRLNIDRLITIGGDDTAYSAHMVETLGQHRIRVAHVPKTIDNDLNLPHGISTFGYQTARHIGVDIVQNIMSDAHTTHRWYFVIAMGRKAGHLALGIGKSAGATLTLIPEEFKEEKIRLSKIIDILAGTIIKRISMDRKDGVAILAEGLVLRLEQDDLKQLLNIERDAHDNIRLAEINFGEILKEGVQKKLAEFGIKSTIVAKNIGYELRCADPIPSDMEYTRDLGYCASQFLLEGGSGAMISIQGGKFMPIYLKDILDPKTGKMKVRMVRIDSEMYKIAREYMLRLKKEDFDDPHELAKLASTCKVSMSKLKESFRYVVDNDFEIGEEKKTTPLPKK